MLILTRKQSESVIIDSNIKVSILGTKGQDVKIGIQVPEDVKVWREEIFARLDDEQDEEDI